MSELARVGNDVVDLRDPDSNPQTHPRRFDERVFSLDERRLLEEAPDELPLRWRLWSAKEAAFKAARKRDRAVVFSPPRFEVEVRGPGESRVTYRASEGVSERFDLRWWQTNDAVHAIARPASAGAPAHQSDLIHGFRRFRRPHRLAVNDSKRHSDAALDPSQAVRDFAIERVAAALDLPRADLEIRTHQRVPSLWRGDHPVAADLSLSHHGDWIAFACQIRQIRQIRRIGWERS